MNYREMVKEYQAHRRQATNFASLLPSSAASFFQQLLNIDQFTKLLPDDITYRKKRLQRMIANVVQCVDQIKYELQSLVNDCGIQIHGLIASSAIEKLEQERKNAKRTNARLARRSYNKRKS